MVVYILVSAFGNKNLILEKNKSMLSANQGGTLFSAAILISSGDDI